MKFIVTKPVEIEVCWVVVRVPVRYGIEDIPSDFPMHDGDVWEAVVNIETGQIRGWPKGYGPCELSMKVVDQGVYTLLDAAEREVAKIDHDSVPSDVVPGRYGDYIELSIDADGVITNWPKKPKLSEFFGEGR